MTGPHRTAAQAFVELADTLVNDFDLVDFLYLVTVRVQQTLDVGAVGLLLADNHGGLNVIAASSEQARILELFQLQNAEGPCLDCYRSGRAVSCPDLARESHRWPRFVARALEAGFTAVHALPMRLRDEVIGGMNLFTTSPGQLDDETLDVAQALTDVAAIGLLHERVSHQRALLIEQLQTALHSRLTIEQAKGVVAEHTGVSIGEAFDRLRRYAHSHQRKLADLADAVVRNDPTVVELLRKAP